MKPLDGPKSRGEKGPRRVRGGSWTGNNNLSLLFLLLIKPLVRTTTVQRAALSISHDNLFSCPNE